MLSTSSPSQTCSGHTPVVEVTQLNLEQANFLASLQELNVPASDVAVVMAAMRERAVRSSDPPPEYDFNGG
jgi:hypothetical protein